MTSPAVVFADPSGVIRHENSGMTELLGFTESEAVGATTLDLIEPPDYRERHWIGYQGSHRAGRRCRRPRLLQRAGAAQGRRQSPTRSSPQRDP